jgi:hypothetical protein
MAGQVLKVLLNSRIFDYSSLLEDSKEVSTVGIIPTQLVQVKTCTKRKSYFFDQAFFSKERL